MALSITQKLMCKPQNQKQTHPHHSTVTNPECLSALEVCVSVSVRLWGSGALELSQPLQELEVLGLQLFPLQSLLLLARVQLL